MPSLAATSLLHDTRTAAHDLADRLERPERSESPAALLVVASFHHRAALPEAFELLRGTIRPEAAVAITAAGVIGNGRLLEGMPAMAATILDEPDLDARTIRITPDDGPPSTWSQARREMILAGGLPISDPEVDGVKSLLWVDPFSSDPPGLAAAGVDRLVHGGVLSGSSQAGGNLLISGRLGEASVVSSEGAVGLAVRTARATAVGCPGARPIGRSCIVTAADGTRLLGLGGRPVLEVLREALESSGDIETLEGDAPMGGIAIGIAVDEFRPDGGEPICRLRPLTGVVRSSKNSDGSSPPGLRLAEPIRPGRTVRFHRRDPEWAAATCRDRLRQGGVDLDTSPAVLVAISTARELAEDEGEGTGVSPDPALGGPMGVGLRTAGEFVSLGGRTEIDTLSASLFALDAPPSLS